MNIFVTNECPVKSAQNLDDKRVVKMVLETAQLLSTALRFYVGDSEADSLNLYKTTHLNHPCNIWVRKNRSNFLWVVKHFEALCEEYSKRYGRTHACQSKLETFKDKLRVIPLGELLPFANCARNKSLGLDFTEYSDIEYAYQLYLAHRWDTDKREPTWYGSTK